MVFESREMNSPELGKSGYKQMANGANSCSATAKKDNVFPRYAPVLISDLNSFLKSRDREDRWESAKPFTAVRICPRHQFKFGITIYDFGFGEFEISNLFY